MYGNTCMFGVQRLSLSFNNKLHGLLRVIMIGWNQRLKTYLTPIHFSVMSYEPLTLLPDLVVTWNASLKHIGFWELRAYISAKAIQYNLTFWQRKGSHQQWGWYRLRRLKREARQWTRWGFRLDEVRWRLWGKAEDKEMIRSTLRGFVDMKHGLRGSVEEEATRKKMETLREYVFLFPEIWHMAGYRIGLGSDLV